MRFFGWMVDVRKESTVPLESNFELLGVDFSLVASLRRRWTEADIHAVRKKAAQEYWSEWITLVRSLENDRRRRPPKDVPLDPFRWRTREGAVVESSCIRMETICTCVALSEFAEDDREQERWLQIAWEETRKWIQYPNYCLPPSLREDYLAIRINRLLISEGADGDAIWKAVLERRGDDLVRAAVHTHPAHDARAYIVQMSGGEHLARAFLSTVTAEEKLGRDRDQIAFLAVNALKIIRRRCPDADPKIILELIIREKIGRASNGKFPIENTTHDSRR